ncbi:unnamed protein product, partial [Iphiclides podalirius]
MRPTSWPDVRARKYVHTAAPADAYVCTYLRIQIASDGRRAFALCARSRVQIAKAGFKLFSIAAAACRRAVPAGGRGDTNTSHL